MFLKRGFFLLLGLSIMFSAFAQSPLDSDSLDAIYVQGVEAYDNNDYVTAAAHWRSAAEAGHAAAEYE